MVLAELGKKINSALQKLQKATVIDETLINEILQQIVTALLQSDVNVKFVARLRDQVKVEFQLQEESGANMRKIIQQAVVKELTAMLQTEKKPFQPKRGKSNVIMFVGLQGSGKTTTCAKYAHYWQRKGWRVALVCADTFRAGAFDQLKQNAAQVLVPIYGNYSESDPVTISEEGVSVFQRDGYEIIIVDTSGRHKQEQELFDEMRQVNAAITPDEIIFVMDSSIGQACFDQATAFRKTVNVGSVIITKLDGHAKGGGALSAVAATESPITFIGTGEHFDDLEPFDAQSFIKRLLGLGDIGQLFEAVKEVVNMDDQQKVMQTMMEGQFSIRDLQSQFNSILKLGSINNFMSMIPGMGTSILNKSNQKESINRIKRFLHIMDSMNDNELDGKSALNMSRIVRIAKGSGTSIEEVNIMLEEYKRLSKVIQNLGQTNLGKGNDMTNLTRNPNQMMSKMGSAIDPQMIGQLGGMGNIMNMMKEMSQMDGFGDMMKQFGGGALPGNLGLGGGGGKRK